MTLPEPNPPTAEEESQHFTYVTHRIPWYVRAMWIAFWIGLVWYVIKYAIPATKQYF
ncbi:MAG: hypothetical protein L6Q92_11225 [Phycisphaerae bacterium]|nr:hypothetical protein [Phycisphaerae bacterium]